jgi:hypothetical protein
MSALSRHEALTRYVVTVHLEVGRFAWDIDNDYFAATHRFYFHYAVMMSKKRVRLGRYRLGRIVYCAQHKIYNTREFDVRDLSDNTLIRSSQKPFTGPELNYRDYFSTVH